MKLPHQIYQTLSMVGTWKKEPGKIIYVLVGHYHSNFAITKTVLHISADNPHLGASPGRIIDCDCCGKGLVEIKCPRKYSAGLIGWENDKNFAIDLSKNV